VIPPFKKGFEIWRKDNVMAETEIPVLCHV